MISPFSRAPHARGAPSGHADAPNAALLIDFDNVTMGMRSDLSKELKNLLNSDIIKGKVTVQRAYADWRRYPQYIVPLSENSVDLIFAPAYGSSKKNATDIRMAIDAIELVFIRPEIGTFILLTGDSDFSSLVLKLKEYGKYVIGVGIQESSSDILVQNCDEYYSYTSLTGLRKTTDSANKPVDPWVLVEAAVDRMASRDDVMRSDRLKQVMIEIDPGFDEGNFGFSKFSKFVSEAAGRNLIRLKKLDNGQYEVSPAGGGRSEDGKERGGQGRRGDGRDRTRDRGQEEAAKAVKGPQSEAREDGPSRGKPARGGGEVAEKGKAEAAPDTPAETGGDPLKEAYGLLVHALKELTAGGEETARDSDLKRKMLEIRPDFDEGELGFGKFSRFLRQAHDHEVVDLQKSEEGSYQVGFRREIALEGKEGTATAAVPAEDGKAPAREKGKDKEKDKEKGKATATATATAAGASAPATPVGWRPGSGRRKGHGAQEGPPPLLEGQVVPSSKITAPSAEPSAGTEPTVSAAPASQPRGRRSASTSPERPASGGGAIDAAELGLPTDGPAVIRYFTNSYKGVGQKTAEALVEAFGTDLWRVMTQEPARVVDAVTPRRAEQLLKAWKTDLERRLADSGPVEEESAPPPQEPAAKSPSRGRRPRRGGKSRSRGDRGGGSTGKSGS